MVRFTEPDWNSLDPAAPDAHAPSFLRDWAERPDPTDLRLHFADAGPVYGAPAEPARPAPAAPGGYSAVGAAEWTSHEVASDSWLAGVPALAHPAPGQDAARALPAPGHANGRSWDPLSDPWPASDDRLEATLLEHAVREEVDPLGLAYAPLASAPPAYDSGRHDWARHETAPYETAPYEIARHETARHETARHEPVVYEPVVFEPAPYAPPAPPAAEWSTRREEHAAIQTQPVYLDPDHPSGPLPRAGVWPPSAVVPESPAGLERPARAAEAVPPAESAAPTGRPYDVTLVGPLGEAEFGFGNGWWYSLAGDAARPVSVGVALRAQPDKAGQITQLVCWWLRENPNAARAIDLATELSLAVSDLAGQLLANQAFAAPNPASRHARV